MFKTKSNNPRLLLARLRKADFSHAGDDEAIDIVLKKIIELTMQVKTVLDVGCGLGGTASYIQKKTAWDVYGMDIDKTAISHAQSHYPGIKLFECDVKNIDKLFNQNYFDLIYSFNVFYVLPDHLIVLKKLSDIAKPGAVLSIFDYTQAHSKDLGLKDLSNKPMHPININQFKKWLDEAGWGLIDIVDLSNQYDVWYTKLLNNLRLQKENLLKEFTSETYDYVFSVLLCLSSNIKIKELNGSLILAKKPLTNS